jgi:hypothetical protein
MSDGASDVRGLRSLAGRIEEAAYVLRDLLKSVEEGQRGVRFNAVFLVNRILEPAGYQLRKLP